MSEKIWIIENNTEEQISENSISQKSSFAFEEKITKQKDPSLAYSLSIIIWGCGQFYNRQWKLGTLLLLLMITFYAFISIFAIYWGPVTSYFESIDIDRSGTLLILGSFYLSGLIVWYLNAWQAYYKSNKINSIPFKRTQVRFLPALCSLLMPGWGQLLNGQPKKSLFFQLFALTGVAASSFILIIFLLWPTIELPRSRSVIEWIFSISIIILPFILMMWMFNIFDAAKVSLDNKKRGPLPVRIKNAKNRFRYRIKIHGWKNVMIPLIKRTVLIILLLTFCVITYDQVPKKFYMQQLQNLGDQMSKKEMTIIPNIIKKLPDSISLGK